MNTSVTSIKLYDLKSIKSQLVSNIYHILRSKGYDPEEGVNVEEILGFRPEVIVSASNSLCYGDDAAAYPFLVGYIRCMDEEEFEVYDDDPDLTDDAEMVDNRDFFIESLVDLFNALKDMDDKTE